MPETIHYSKAPIVEAILAIQVECTVAPEYEQFSDSLGEYRSVNPVYESEFVFNIEDASSKGNTKTVGRKYMSSDGKQVAQFKVDGFMFSRLAPYDTWESFSAEAKRLFELYVAAIDTSWNVTSVLLRYINKLSLPVGPSLDKYLNVYAHLPESFPSSTQGYFIRLELSLTEPVPGVLTMQHAMLQEAASDTYSFLIDNEFRFPTGARDEQLWSLFLELRHLKNQTFERTLTERAKDLIR